MRCIALVLVGLTAAAAETDLARMIAKIDDFAIKEAAVARVDTWLKLAVALETTDAELCREYLARATDLLRRHPEIPITRMAVVNLFALDPLQAPKVLLARSDPAPARARIIDYLLTRGQAVEAAALLDPKQLKAEELTGDDLPNLVTDVLDGLGKLAEAHPAEARNGLSRILTLLDNPRFGIDGSRRLTAVWPVGVKTLTTRDTVLFPIAVLMHRIDPVGYAEHESLFAPWADLLATRQVAFSRPLWRKVEYVNGQAPKAPKPVPDVEKIPLADVLRTVQGELGLAERVTIRLVELKRDRDEILAAARVYLDVLERGAHNPDSYEYLAGLIRNYSFSLGAENPSIQARLALMDLTSRLNAQYDFILPDQMGKPVGLRAQKGKIVLLNFWATWCGPCRAEMPMLDRIYRQYRERGLVVLAITDEPAAVAQRFIANQGLSFPVLIDSQHSVGDHYGVLGLPVTKIIDRTGVIRATFREIRESDLMQALSSAGLAVER